MHYPYGPRFRSLHWCTEQIVSSALAQMDLTSAQGHIMGFLVHQVPPLLPGYRGGLSSEPPPLPQVS